MTDRTWQMVAVAALGVFVVGGLLPVWPDAVQVGALVLGVALAAAAVLLRRRTQRDDDEGHRRWGGAHDAPQHAQRVSPGAARQPDQRHGGMGIGGTGMGGS